MWDVGYYRFSRRGQRKLEEAGGGGGYYKVLQGIAKVLQGIAKVLQGIAKVLQGIARYCKGGYYRLFADWPNANQSALGALPWEHFEELLHIFGRK